jgi:hypothetical protein
MAAQVQTSLFEVSPYITGKKRVRYKVPTYTKSYTFWHINPETEEIQFDGDERHIFRVKTLHHLYSIIFGYSGVNVFEQFERKDLNGLTIWGEEKQAEIQNTSHLPIKDRVKLHLRLLRLLRKGFSIEEALYDIQKR